MKRYRINKKDIKALEEQFSSVSLKLPDAVDYYEKDDDVFYLFQEKPILFQKDGTIYPTLRALTLMDRTKVAVVKVDRGAIPFVVKGADVMRPGIVTISDNVLKDQWLVVQDQEHGKDLGIGKALFSSEEMRSMPKGKVVLALHWFGDRLWSFGE